MSTIDSKTKSDLVDSLNKMDEKLEALAKLEPKNFPGNWTESISASRETLSQCLSELEAGINFKDTQELGLCWAKLPRLLTHQFTFVLRMTGFSAPEQKALASGIVELSNEVHTALFGESMEIVLIS